MNAYKVAAPFDAAMLFIIIGFKQLQLVIGDV